MTACNMSIEGGARAGYVNPDAKTFDYLKGVHTLPKMKIGITLASKWASFASDEGCQYDDLVKIDASEIGPTVTWGINPSQAIGIDETIPDPTVGRKRKSEHR